MSWEAVPQELVVQISANPVLKFNLSLSFSACLLISKFKRRKTPIDPDKISKELFVNS